jgi:hypothetical protein
MVPERDFRATALHKSIAYSGIPREKWMFIGSSASLAGQDSSESTVNAVEPLAQHGLLGSFGTRAQ